MRVLGGKRMPETKPWRDDLVDALRSIGGAGSLDDIYHAVEQTRKPLSKQWKGTVRCKLQQFSSDSQWWRKSNRNTNRADLFRNPRTGYWELRPPSRDTTETESVQRLEQQVAAQNQTIHDLNQRIHRLEHRIRALRVLFFTAPSSRTSRRDRR